MISACSRTFSGKVGLIESASFMSTLSGVLSAWARLPTWVRARSTISRLASMQLIDFGRQRRDVLRKFAGDAFGLAAADRRHPFLQHPQRAQAEADRERRRADQRQRQRQEGRRERPFEAALLALDHVGVGGDLDQIAPFVAGVDLALDHPQLVPARPDHVAAEDRAVILADGEADAAIGSRTATSRPGFPAGSRRCG